LEDVIAGSRWGFQQMYENSVMALHKLLELPRTAKALANPSSDVSCKITAIPTQITYLENGIKYYGIEVTCKDGRQYAIQAYGDEAEALFSEAHKCVLCGNSVKEEEKGNLIEEKTENGHLVFVENNCQYQLKRFESVYGKEFFEYQ